MESNDNNSLILQLGNLKLSDTEYTFGKHKIIGKFEYTPLNENKNKQSESSQLGHFVTGDHRLGTEISYNDNKIFLAYGANRPTSNAQNLMIGYLAKTNYHFIKEYFSDIYSENPKLIARSIITIDSLFKPTKKVEKIIFDIYEKSTKSLSKSNLQILSNWIKHIEIFEDAFTKEQLTALSKIRFLKLENEEEKQKYLKYHQ